MELLFPKLRSGPSVRLHFADSPLRTSLPRPGSLSRRSGFRKLLILNRGDRIRTNDLLLQVLLELNMDKGFSALGAQEPARRRKKIEIPHPRRTPEVQKVNSDSGRFTLRSTASKNWCKSPKKFQTPRNDFPTFGL